MRRRVKGTYSLDVIEKNEFFPCCEGKLKKGKAGVGESFVYNSSDLKDHIWKVMAWQQMMVKCDLQRLELLLIIRTQTLSLRRF